MNNNKVEKEYDSKAATMKAVHDLSILMREQRMRESIEKSQDLQDLQIQDQQNQIQDLAIIMKLFF